MLIIRGVVINILYHVEQYEDITVADPSGIYDSDTPGNTLLTQYMENVL